MECLPQPIPAGCCTLEARLFGPSPRRQTPAHGVLRDGTAEPLLNGQMDVGNAHRPPSGYQYPDNGSLHHSIAQTPQRRRGGDRSAQLLRSQLSDRLRPKHRLQRSRRV
jgi:hypothetical protein